MNQPQGNREAKLALINAILNAYLTTRVVQTDPAVHILSKLGGELDRRIAEIASGAPGQPEPTTAALLAQAMHVEQLLYAAFVDKKREASDSEDRKTYQRYAQTSAARMAALETVRIRQRQLGG